MWKTRKQNLNDQTQQNSEKCLRTRTTKNKPISYPFSPYTESQSISVVWTVLPVLRIKLHEHCSFVALRVLLTVLTSPGNSKGSDLKCTALSIPACMLLSLSCCRKDQQHSKSQCQALQEKVVLFFNKIDLIHSQSLSYSYGTRMLVCRLSVQDTLQWPGWQRMPAIKSSSHLMPLT